MFGISFRTPPDDSTGVPHVLEHSVLCGSRKYKVKEPFVDLLKGSLQNFLNAFTYPDRTCYPLASTNTKDFYNLVNVYLDAVLHPRAINDPQVLAQEGWHYELEDASQPLTYKGVVYNEMKGVYSSPDSLLSRATQQALFPKNTYGVDSGGDPLKIPDLSFEQFKSFHSTYYHPSNSRVYFYGNDDPLVRLNLLDEYLSEFDSIPVTSQIEFQPKDQYPSKIELKFPTSEGGDKKNILTINWLLNDVFLDSKESLALAVLDRLLIGTSSSILRKELTESNLGDSVTGGGLSDELLQNTFSIGLKGVKPEDSEKLEAKILSILSNAAKEGFEETDIRAAMNTLEFRLREFNTGSFPKGLSLMLGMLSNWIYDKPPFEAVRFENSLKELKLDLASGKPVFQDLLTKYFVNNNHRVTVEMSPDEAMEKNIVDAEESHLKKIKDNMTSEQIQKVINETKFLKECQLAEDSDEQKATVPRLGLNDIEKTGLELPITIERLGKDNDDGITILSHKVLGNGILYADIAFDFSHIDHEDIPYLSLFSRMIMESGTKDFDEISVSRKIGSETGGISTSFFTDMKHAGSKIGDSNDVVLYFMIRGKVVSDNAPIMFDIISDLLNNANLDNKKRAVEMLKERKIQSETSVISNGHSFASARLSARFSFLGYLGEKMGGLTAVRQSGIILEQAENDWASVEKHLVNIRNSIVRRGDVVINLTGDEKTIKSAKSDVDKFIETIPNKKLEYSVSLMDTWNQGKDKLLPIRNEGITIPSQVNYVVKGGPLFEQGEEVSGAFSVVTRYLSTGFLWDNVRVLGGAYGGFARFSESTGRFAYISYRDPNLQTTLDVYDKTARSIIDSEITHEDILQGIIGSIGDLDAPMSPDQQGFSSFAQFVTGESIEDRKLWRSQILNSSPKDFLLFAERLEKLNDNGSISVFGSQAALEQVNNELSNVKKLVIEKAF